MKYRFTSIFSLIIAFSILSLFSLGAFSNTESSNATTCSVNQYATLTDDGIICKTIATQNNNNVSPPASTKTITCASNKYLYGVQNDIELCNDIASASSTLPTNCVAGEIFKYGDTGSIVCKKQTIPNCENGQTLEYKSTNGVFECVNLSLEEQATSPSDLCIKGELKTECAKTEKTSGAVNQNEIACMIIKRKNIGNCPVLITYNKNLSTSTLEATPSIGVYYYITNSTCPTQKPDSIGAVGANYTITLFKWTKNKYKNKYVCFYKLSDSSFIERSPQISLSTILPNN